MSDDVDAERKTAQVRGILLGKWAKNLQPGDHVQLRRAPCGCRWVTVNTKQVHHVDCQRHAAVLRRRAREA